MNPGASEDQIRDVESKLEVSLPGDYIEFMMLSNGAEGNIGKAYLSLLPVDRMLIENEMYKINEYAPSLILFGSNLGGTAYCFDAKTSQMPIVEVEFSAMDLEEAEVIAMSFIGFLESLYITESKFLCVRRLAVPVIGR